MDNRPKDTSTAAQWLLRLRAADGDVTVDQAFRNWLREDSRHEDELVRCEYAAHLTQELANDPDLREDFDLCAALAERHRRKPRSVLARWRQWLRQHLIITSVPVAAAAAALLVITMVPGTPQPLYYQTAVGEQRTVVLPDQSRVTLNTNTRLSVSYSENQRQLTIQKGEAWFDVSKDGQRRFSVQAGNGVVTVLGTEFNVIMAGDEIVVAVLEGAVSVLTAREPEVTSGKISDSGAKRLQTGESITYWRSGAIGQVVTADTRRIRGWRAGKTVFHKTRLADAIAEHNRYTHNKFVIANSDLKDLRINGTFKLGDSDALAFLLEQSLGIKAQVQGNVTVLTK